MNTQVTPDAPGTTVHAIPLAVAETVPMPLSPVSAATTELGKTPGQQASATKRTALIDDFLDDEDVQPENLAAANTEEEGSLEGLEDEIELEIEEVQGSGDGDLEGLEEEDPESGEAVNANQDLEGLRNLDDALVGDDEQAMVVIDVFKKKCTDCTHLVPWGTKTHKRCHFTNGNELCPASSVRIRRYIPVDDIVSRFMAAESQGDSDRLVTLYSNLKTKAPDVQEEIHAALKAERERKAKKAIGA